MLKAIYHEALQRCAPDVLVKAHVDASMPRNVVAIGKCAGALLDGVAAVLKIEHAFVAIPRGYRLPKSKAEIHEGGHPHMTRESFAAGRALLDFVAAHHDILFLISGGGSACVEVPREGVSEDDVAHANAELIKAGLPIGEINKRRSELSAIKGGKLRERVKGRAVTLVYSDVSTGKSEDVASGPTITPDSGGIVIADNTTLVRAAASLVDYATILEEQLECDVQEAAEILVKTPGRFLVAGGEPTVIVRGDGEGGRCSELAVRFAMISTDQALFGSSDGVDGNSGAAGVWLPKRQTLGGGRNWQAAMARSDTMSIATQVGEPLMISAAGNNLRDLFLVARD
jgi:hydroxypyruvate reductase